MPRKPKIIDEIVDESTSETTATTTSTAGKLRPRVPFDAFVERFNGLNPTTDCPSLYIYRTKPETDIRLSGRKVKYIAKLNASPADLRGHIKTNHGGGEYALQLNADNRQPSAVAESILEIPLSECDPILDPTELVRGNPDTEQLITRWIREGKVFVDGGNILRAAQPGANGNVQTPQAQTNTIADRIMGKALDNLLTPQPAISPIREVMEVMREAREVSKEGEGGMVSLLSKQLLQAEQRNHDLMLRLLDGQKQQTSSADPVETAISVVERIGKLGLGGNQHWAVDLAKELGKAAAPLFGTYLMMKQGIDPMAGAGANGAPAAAGEPTTATPAPATQQMSPQLAQMYQLARRVLDRVKAGVPGGDFANSVVDMMGEPVYEQLAARGKEVLINAIRSFPDLTAQADEQAAALDKFMDEFLTAFAEEGETADATA